jgi:hypothetical protein
MFITTKLVTLLVLRFLLQVKGLKQECTCRANWKLNFTSFETFYLILNVVLSVYSTTKSHASSCSKTSQVVSNLLARIGPLAIESSETSKSYVSEPSCLRQGQLKETSQ